MVARVGVVQKVSYAEAVNRVVEEDGSTVRDPKRFPINRRRPIESDRNNKCFSKVGFLAFIDMVINYICCSVQDFYCREITRSVER